MKFFLHASFFTLYLIKTLLSCEESCEQAKYLYQSTFLNSSEPVHSLTQEISDQIDHQFRLLNYTHPSYRSHSCRKIQNLFLTCIQNQDRNNLFKIILQAISKKIPEQFHAPLTSCQTEWTLPPMGIITLICRAVESQDIYGYCVCLDLIKYDQDKQLAHLLAFETFIKQKTLKKSFTKSFGKVIDIFLEKKILDNDHILNLLKILNKYDPYIDESTSLPAPRSPSQTINLVDNPEESRYFFYVVRKKLNNIHNP